MSFKDLKKKSAENLQRLIEENEKVSKPSGSFGNDDPDDWYPGVDKSGNGMAIIRFLPGPEDDRIDFVRWIGHSFQNPTTGLYYIENSLRTFGETVKDPVADFNKKLWNSTKDDESPQRKQSKEQARKMNFRANIFVLADAANPANNGKVKKFKFGKNLYNYIANALTPPQLENMPVEKEWNPFDLYTGANFKIKIFTKKADGKTFRDYSTSSWDQNGPLADDKKLEVIYNEINGDPKWSLKQYIAEDKFKTYEALKARLDLVVGFDTLTGKPLEGTPKAQEATQAPKQREVAAKPAETSSEPSGDESDDYFKQYLND